MSRAAGTPPDEDFLPGPRAVHRAGESSLLAEYPDTAAVLAAAAAVRALAPAHLLDLVPAERTLLLRGAERPPAKKLLCSWCEDIVDGNQAALFVAPLAGESGRRGNTVGTAICADLRCSRNVRRAPSSYELRSEDPALLEYHQQQKIAGLQERSARFVRTVMAG